VRHPSERDPAEILDRPAPPPHAELRYGERPDQVADLWRPPEAAASRTPTEPPAPPAPLVVVLHGGFWRAAFDRTHVRPLCAALAAAGYLVAAPEYRRTGQPGGGWPGTADDVRAALTSLPEHLATGATAPRPVLLLGHSAGGHLALWAASQVRPTGLAGAVSLAGVCDLRRADELGLGAAGDRGAVDALLGGSPGQVPDRYAAADPMLLASPRVPVELVHGTLDTIVPPELSRRYAAYLATARTARVRLTELAGIEHFGLIDPLSPAWPAVLAALRAIEPPGPR
jgi:acetyl esterase/lipase